MPVASTVGVVIGHLEIFFMHVECEPKETLVPPLTPSW